MEFSVLQIAVAILTYAVAVNIGSGVSLWLDKRRAVAGRRRISEQALLVWALVGGWPLGIWTMLQIRHKTSKLLFKVQYALTTILNIAGIAAVVFYVVQN
ncbi:MAG: DUF1294 domain-containing protein [Dehalococcoidia bacterium]